MFFYQISTLTADIDIINSTTNSTGKPTADARPGDGDDVFIAGGATPTLNPGDQLDGMGGTDTLKVYGNDSVANLTAATIKNIEIVQAIGTGDSSTATAVNVSANADVKEVWLVNALNANTVTATTAQTVGIEGKAAAGLQTVTYSGDTDGTADAATIMLKDANTSAGVTITGAPAAGVVTIEKLTLEATGKNVLGTLADAKLTDLVINGTGSVKATVDGANGALKTIDASANKGGVDLTLTTGDMVAAGTTITGGSGDDKIDGFAATTAGVKFTVDLGAGNDTFTVHTGVAAGSVIKGGEGTDTLVLNAVTGLDAKAGKMFDGFENIKLDGASSYHVGDIKGITGYEIGGTSGNATFTDLANNAKVTISASSATDTLNLDAEAATLSGSTVTVALNNGTTTATTGVTVNALATNAQVVDIISGGLTSSGNVITASDSATVSNYFITGDQGFKMGASDAAAALKLVDASGMTGKTGLDFTLGARTGDDTITVKGSAGADKLVVAANSANDVFTFVGNGGHDLVGFTLAATAGEVKLVEKATTLSGSDMAGASIRVGATAASDSGAVTALNKVVVDFSTEMAGLLKVDGVKLVDMVATTKISALGTLLDENAKFDAKSNIKLSNTAGVLAIQIDVNGDGVFNATSDYQVTIVGAISGNSTLGYDAGTGDFTFASVAN